MADICPFDLAAECESRLTTLSQAAGERAAKGEGIHGSDFSQKLIDMQILRAQCIATDDPRLKEK